MVVAQLAERSLPITVVLGSNPIVGKVLNNEHINCQLTKIKKKEASKSIFFEENSFVGF